MKKILISSSIVLTSLLSIAQGSGKAIDFEPNAAANNHIVLGNYPIGTADFTVEFWLNAGSVVGDPAIFSNKDWNSGNNTGVNIAIQGNGGDLDINFKGATGGRADMNVVHNFNTGWHHVSITFNRAGNMVAYVNGVQKASASIAGSTGSIIGSFPFVLGEDGTGNYTYGGTQYHFRGAIDELRIWNGVRSLTNIRDFMCQKLSGSEPGLIAYYQFEEATGNTALDFTGNFNGTLNNSAPSNANRILSGAALGDESVELYPGSWVGQNLNLTSAAFGNISLSTFSGTAQGLHLYRVDNAPNTIAGISNAGGNNTYYGYFVVEPSTFSFVSAYDYSNFPQAVTDENSILLYGRSANNSPTWMDDAANVNTAANVITKIYSDNQKELIIGNFVSAPCNAPTSLNASNLTLNSAQLSWISGGSGIWNIEYGLQGFTQGTGSTVQVSSNPFLLSGLTPNTAYEFYVQDDCGASSSTFTGPFLFTTSFIPSNQYLGSGMALNFNGGGSEWVNCTGGTAKVSASSLGLPTSGITLEAWVYPRQFQEWRSIISFLQDNGATEGGWDLELGNNGTFGFALAGGSNGMTYLYTNGSYPNNRWYHLAATYDGTTMRIYVNGVLDATSTAQTGNIYYLDSWLSIGQYKDDNETYTVNGMIDEVRIWDVARSQAQIRADMCRKISGGAPNLFAYYRLDEITGTTVFDIGPAGKNGEMTNMATAARVVSSAPIGDNSEQAYHTNWNSQAISLSSGSNGLFGVANVSNDPKGIHIYRVDGPEDQMPGVDYPIGGNAYFGVFVAENFTSDATYVSEWQYAGFVDAEANENDLILLNRVNKLSQTWGVTPTTSNLTNNIIATDTLAGRKEFLLALSTSQTCQIPTMLAQTGATGSSADITWTSGGSPQINMQYGSSGFSLGSGTLVNNLSGATHTVSGLTTQQFYDVYVQDTCVGNNASLWYGPLIFSTENCDLPFGLSAGSISHNSAQLSWNGGNASTWDIIWGPQGFNILFGIQVQNIPTPSYLLNGLSPITSYDYYVRSKCSGFASQYVGPFTFTTTVNQTGMSTLNPLTFNVFPNPVNSICTIQFTNQTGNHIDIMLTDVSGKTVFKANHSVNGNNAIEIQMLDYASGYYLLSISNEHETKSFSIIKN